MKFHGEKDLAVCGLACMLCSKEECPGCKAGGCEESRRCSVYKCAEGKGLDGCYQCGDFPCGDYDQCRTEQEVIALLKNGRPDPYAVCPAYESKSFLLRMVSTDDADELLECYQDPKAQPLFNSDNCDTDFCFKSEDDLKDYIAGWIMAYDSKEFVRFSIVDKALGKAVGTIEIFGMPGAEHSSLGLLRLDICSKYEHVVFLNELIQIADCFFSEFGCEKIVTKAVPQAVSRINVLLQNGYTACPADEEWERRDYYIKRRPH